MLPVILVAVGAYLIGDSVLGDKKSYADGGMMAKGGKTDEFADVFNNNVITEREINLIKTRLNNNREDQRTQDVVQYIWDNNPKLTGDQNAKGIKFLRNLWKSPTGKERINNPFGYREQDALETFEYFELAGFHDISRYGQSKFYVPLYNVIGNDSNFQYYYDGNVNIVGKDGMEVAKGGMMAKGGEIKYVSYTGTLFNPKEVKMHKTKEEAEERLESLKGERGLIPYKNWLNQEKPNNYEPINFPTSNQTEESAKKWLNELIKEKGRNEAAKIVRYNLTGKNPYYRYNNIYDQWLSSATLNEKYAKGGMMAKGGKLTDDEFVQEAVNHLNYNGYAKVESDGEGGWLVSYLDEDYDYIDVKYDSQGVVNLALDKRFMADENDREEDEYGMMMAKGGMTDFIKRAIESASGDKISKTPNSQVYYSTNNPQVAYYIKGLRLYKYDAITGERYPIGELKDYMADGGMMAKGGFTSSFSGTPDRRRVTKEKGGMMAKGGYVTDLDEVVASSDLKEELKSKMKKGDEIVAFSYTDYGGSFGDKVAIEYFKENHPKNIVFEETAYNGQNGIVFGEVAEDFLEETEDYPLGYEDMESFYYDMQSEQEEKDFKLFLSDIKNKYTIKKDTLDWLLENKGGYYSIEPNMVDFSYSELENELEEEGLIKRKKMAKGGKLVGKQKKLDLNKNGKLDAEDFKMLRGEKMAKGGKVGIKEYKIYPMKPTGVKGMITADYDNMETFVGTEDEAVARAKEMANSNPNFVRVEVKLRLKTKTNTVGIVDGQNKQYSKGGKLVGKQKNLDVNKNGKLDAEDFKMLRGEKMADGGLVVKK